MLNDRVSSAQGCWKRPYKKTCAWARISHFSSFLVLKSVYFFAKMIIIVTESTKRQRMEFVIRAAAFGSSKFFNSICNWIQQGPQCRNGIFPIQFCSNPKADEECLILVFVFFSSVSTTIVQIYWDQNFVLASFLNVFYLHQQEPFLMPITCGKGHRHSEKYLYLPSLAEE